MSDEGVSPSLPTGEAGKDEKREGESGMITVHPNYHQSEAPSCDRTDAVNPLPVRRVPLHQEERLEQVYA